MSAQTATPKTVAAYITAAQNAVVANDFSTARTQITLAEMELAKLPVTDTGEDNSSTSFRQTLSNLRNSLDYLESSNRRTSGTRFAPVRFV